MARYNLEDNYTSVASTSASHLEKAAPKNYAIEKQFVDGLKARPQGVAAVARRATLKRLQLFAVVNVGEAAH